MTRIPLWERGGRGTNLNMPARRHGPNVNLGTYRRGDQASPRAADASTARVRSRFGQLAPPSWRSWIRPLTRVHLARSPSGDSSSVPS